jgi:hypothetical protein
MLPAASRASAELHLVAQEPNQGAELREPVRAPAVSTKAKDKEAVKDPVDVDPLRIGPILLGLLVAFVTVALQIWLKFTSREPPPEKRHGLVREDLVWWIEWVVAAVISFTVLALTTAGSGGDLSQTQVIALVVVFAVGLSGLPGLVRAFGYDKSVNPPLVNKVMGIFVPNLLGAAILLVAIVSGASLAG